MSEIVLDIAWDRPTVAAIQAVGNVVGIVRYLSTDSTKNLTTAETAIYHSAGLGTAVVWETTATRSTQGYQAGVDDARAAEAQRKADNLPTGQDIYFATDADTSWVSVADYYRGCNDVLGNGPTGLPRTGVYGGIRVIDGAYAAGFRRLWQTDAWSGGQLSAHAVLYQRGTALGGSADINDVLSPDWGQYPRPVTTPQQPPATLILQGDDMPAGQLQPGFGVDPKGNVTHPELAAIVWLGGKGQGAVGGSWLALNCDFGTARLRVAIRHPGGWDVRTVDVDSSKDAVWVANLPVGATHASILRVDRSTATVPDKSAAVPVGYGTVMEIK